MRVWGGDHDMAVVAGDMVVGQGGGGTAHQGGGRWHLGMGHLAGVDAGGLVIRGGRGQGVVVGDGWDSDRARAAQPWVVDA